MPNWRRINVEKSTVPSGSDIFTRSRLLSSTLSLILLGDVHVFIYKATIQKRVEGLMEFSLWHFKVGFRMLNKIISLLFHNLNDLNSSAHPDGGYIKYHDTVIESELNKQVKCFSWFLLFPRGLKSNLILKWSVGL